MAHLSNMEIAGINFVIKGENVTMLKESDPAYQPFLRKESTAADMVHIKAFLEPARMPCTEGLQKIFDSGQSWSMFRDRDYYYVVFDPPVIEEPLWLAKMNRDFGEVRICCSERLVRNSHGKAMLLNPFRYPLDQILLMYVLAEKGGALLHAAGMDLNGKGLVFAGKSGAGKTALSRQCASRSNLEVLSDDRIVVRKMAERFWAFGTPWPGEGGMAENRGVPLSGIFFIYHGSTHSIEEIAPQKALERLLSVVSIPWYDREMIPKMLSFCEDLVFHIPVYAFYFRPSTDVAAVLETFVET